MDFWTERFEHGVAKAGLWSFALGFVYGLLPEKIEKDAFLGLLMTPIALVMLLSGLTLLLVNLYRISMQGRSRYSIGQILAVCFVPFIGAILVSLKLTAPGARGP